MSVSFSSSHRSANKTQESSKSVILTSADISFMNDEEIMSIVDTIDKLTERQKLCTKTYHFKEAEDIKLTVKELKKELILKKKKKIEQRHRDEIAQVLEAQVQELEKFNEFWDDKMAEFNNEASAVEQDMVQQQQDEIQSTKADLNEAIAVKPIKSSEHLRYISMMASLAKNGEFADAEKIMKKCADFEKQELNKAKTEKDKKVKLMITQLENKRKLELSSLRKKISSGKEQMAKIRKDEQEKLLHKFKNMIRELEMAQQLEISKFDVVHKNYAPTERTSVSTNRRKERTSVTSNTLLTSSSVSFTNLDRSFDFFEDESPKKNLADTLITEPTAKKHHSTSASKHKSIISTLRT